MKTLNQNSIFMHNFNFAKQSNINLLDENCPYTNEYNNWDDVPKYSFDETASIDDPNEKPEINEGEIITNDDEEHIITNDEENSDRDFFNAVNYEYVENAIPDEDEEFTDHLTEDDINELKKLMKFMKPIR